MADRRRRAEPIFIGEPIFITAVVQNSTN